jgi:hypothetical protein
MRANFAALAAPIAPSDTKSDNNCHRLKKNFQNLFFILLLVLSPNAFCDDSIALQKIKDYYNEVTARIKNGNFYHREISIAYPVVPAIGTPLSKLVIYYDMISDRPGIYNMPIIKIEHFYQYAGNALYEECLYTETGEPMFCCSRHGQGSIEDAASIVWASSERYYFSGGTAIRFILNSDVIDNPQGESLTKGQQCYTHTQEVFNAVGNLKVPAPFILWGM